MATQAGKAYVGVEFNPGDLAKLEAAAGRAGRNVAGNLDKGTRGASRFGGALKTAGKAALFASIPIAGALVYGIKKSIDAALESEQAQIRLRHAVEKAGGSYQDSTRILDDLQRKQFSVAVSDEELADAYAKIATSTGKVALSQKGLNAALDISAARNIDLNTAAVAVGKALAGQTTGLQRLGIKLDENASKTEILAALQDRFGGAAERQANSTAGAMQKVGLALDELQETAGRAFLPLIKNLGEWLSKTENQKKAQEALKTVMSDAAAVGRFLADAVDKIKAAYDHLGPVIALVKLQLRAEKSVIDTLISVYPVLKRVGQTAADVIRGAWSLVKGLFNAIKGALNALKGVFNAVKGAGKSAGGAIRDAFSGLAGVIDAALGPIRAIADALVATYNAAKSIVGLGGHGEAPVGPIQGAGRYGAYRPNVPPPTATGGVVRTPQVRLVGEDGPEAIIPLNKWGGMQPVVNIVIDGRVLDEVTDYRVTQAFDQLGQYVATRPGR